jgi:imidazole glycerol-phosphate synthase subunit HisF
MALTHRIIACLDVKEGRTVKGVRFEELVDSGDPVDLAIHHAEHGADELVLLDITATHEGRGTFLSTVEQVATVLDIPFTVGGGVRSVDDARALLDAGADKVAVNSAAFRDPALITRLAERFGSQCVVLAIDARIVDGRHLVHLNGGRIATDSEALDWALEGQQHGAGEILLTSMDHDGTRNGFALDLTRSLATTLNIPVIASGGAGRAEHFEAVFREAHADAALAAGIFHSGTLPIAELKRHLIQHGLPIRP